MITYHEALASIEVSITFTASEARRLADLFARLDSGGEVTPGDRNALTGRMKIRFQGASDRAESKARAKVKGGTP